MLHKLLANCYSISKISFFVILFFIAVGTFSFTGFINEKSFFTNVSAQELPESMANSSDIPKSVNNSGNTLKEENESQRVIASGHFANNQMKDGIVTWIQGGFWNLEIDSSENRDMENTNKSAAFDANFTMIKPDGSLSHNHVINNFTSTNVIFAGNDIVITGISDIRTDNATEYSQVPITVHLMGKKVLGLMIDVNKTGGHFSSSNEMFGTTISGFGLETSANNNTSNSSSVTNNQTVLNSNITSEMDSLNHTAH